MTMSEDRWRPLFRCLSPTPLLSPTFDGKGGGGKSLLLLLLTVSTTYKHLLRTKHWTLL